MRRVLQLLENIRNFGYIVAIPGTGGKNPSITQESARPMEWEYFKKVQPFVFSNQGALNHSSQVKEMQKSFDWKEGLAEIKNDAPFKVFSIEHIDGEPIDFFYTQDNGKRETLCNLIVEVEPRLFGFYTLTRDHEDEGHLHVWKSNFELVTVDHFLARIAKEKMGLQSVRQRIVLGTGKLKQRHQINRIIHVAPHKLTTTYSNESYEIDWTHRWTVRGHWRTHQGLGKDREGIYCVNGYTWVLDHEKGPEHLPLINKIRVVE